MSSPMMNRILGFLPDPAAAAAAAEAEDGATKRNADATASAATKSGLLVFIAVEAFFKANNLCFTELPFHE